MMTISEKIKEYLQHPRYPFHMPGHKRNETLTSEGCGVLYDYTEIDEFDNLYQADGIIAESQKRAAKLFGADQTFFLVNGSTVGIMAAIFAAAERYNELAKDDADHEGRKPRILLGPDCHKSVYHALELGHLTGITAEGKECTGRWILTDWQSCVREFEWEQLPARIETTLEQYKGAVAAVVITSPTYEGIISNIERIAQAAHRYGAMLIVDEAHGAHLGMHPYFGENSNKLGADIVIHSMHKTMTGLTQTALLHVNRKEEMAERIMHYLEMLQTSSPSYLLMKSIDDCVALLTEKREELFDAYVERLTHFRTEAKTLKHIELLETEHYDRGKIVLKGNEGRSDWLYTALRDDYQIQPEMAGDDYVIMMTSFADTDEGFEKLLAALRETDQRLEEGEAIQSTNRQKKNRPVRKTDCYEQH